MNTRVSFLLFVGFSLVAPHLAAQDPPETVPQTNQTVSATADLTEELANSSLSDEGKTQLSTELNRARSFDAGAAENRNRLADLKRRVAEADQQQARWRDLATELPSPDPDLPPTSDADTLARVEADLVQEEARLDTVKQAQTGNDPGGVQPPAVLAEQISALTGELAKVTKAYLNAADDGADSTLSSRIRLHLLKAQRSDIESALEQVQFALENHGVLNALDDAEYRYRGREIEVRTARVEDMRRWVDATRAARSSQVRQIAEQAERKADQSRLPQALQVFAQNTADLGREVESITQEEITTQQHTKTLHEKQDELKSDRDFLRRRFEAVGSSSAMGRILLQRWVEISVQSRMHRPEENNRERVGEIITRRLDLDADIQDPEFADRLRAELAVGPAAKPPYDATVDELVASRIDVLSALEEAYRRLDTAIAKQQIAAKQTRAEARLLAESVEEWLMWTRTASTLSLAEVLQWPAMVADHLQAVAREIPDRARTVWSHDRGTLILGGTLILLLVLIRPRIRRRMAVLEKRIIKVRSDRFVYTLEALGWTAVLALPIPAIFLLLGFLHTDPTRTSSFHSLSTPLYILALTLYYLLFLRQTLRPHGIGPRHLRWAKEGCAHVRHELHWLIPAFCGLQLLASLTVFLPQSFASPVVRLYVLLLVLLFATAAFRLLRSGSAWDLSQAQRERPSVFVRWRVVWKGLVLLLAGVLAYLLVLGYAFTAIRFFQLILISQVIAVGMFYLRELCLRAVSVSERRLRFQQLVQNRLEARQQETMEDDSSASDLAVEDPPVDYSQLGEKARRLINAVILLLVVVIMVQPWQESLPLVHALDEVTLPFSKTIEVSGETQIVPLNLADLISAAMIGFIVAVAALNLPALLEIVILQQLPMDQGARYATVTLLQYSIVGAGLFAVFSRLGFSWSSIQWLAAALSVGLGFGLQEIVANFVSGIIILFERPVRVGDVITMGDTTGIVSRIRIRATTVLNWDKQELLIPNKEFITGRLLNWTLSDKLNRIVIPVGVAYGTDTRRALDLAREIVENHPHVLNEPKPLFTFEGFGDSSLNLIVRCYLETMEYRMATITELHTLIHERFVKEGIEIAFPQLDVHWRNPPTGRDPVAPLPDGS